MPKKVWAIQLDLDDTEGHGKKIDVDMSGQAVTVRINETGEEVPGHIVEADDDTEGHGRRF